MIGCGESGGEDSWDTMPGDDVEPDECPVSIPVDGARRNDGGRKCSMGDDATVWFDETWVWFDELRVV